MVTPVFLGTMTALAVSAIYSYVTSNGLAARIVGFTAIVIGLAQVLVKEWIHQMKEE